MWTDKIINENVLSRGDGEKTLLTQLWNKQKKNWFRAFPDVVDGRRTKRIGKKKNADDWWGANIQGTESLSIGQGSMEAIVLNEKCIKVYKSIDNGNDIVMIIINKG